MLGFFRNNRIYFLLILFMVSVHYMSLHMDKRSHKGTVNDAVQTDVETDKSAESAGSENNPVESVRMLADMKVREEKTVQLAQENPKLFFLIGIYNLLILFVIVIGIILDIVLIRAAAKKDRAVLKYTDVPDPVWGIADIVRAVIIFFSAAYSIGILMGLSAGKYPILLEKNFQMVFNTTITNIFGIGIVIYFAVKKYGKDIASLGLVFRNAGKHFFYAVTGYISFVPVMIAIMLVTFLIIKLINYTPPVQPIVEDIIEEKKTGVLWMSAFFAAVFGPIAEEIFFRGFMYPVLKKYAGRVGGMLLISFIFAALHAHIVGFAPIMALGLLLVVMYEMTGSLLPSIFIHVLHNVVMLSFVFIARELIAV